MAQCFLQEMVQRLFLKIYCKESITTCSMTSYKIFPFINLNKYFHNDTSETKVNIHKHVNNGSAIF